MAAERRMELGEGELELARWDDAMLELANEKVPADTDDPCEE